jgi:transcriptional regulator with XRE-family HTH domain
VAESRSAAVAANVRRLRTARAWTQSRLAEDLAGELGNRRDPTAITRIEKGNRAVTLDEAFALAAVFGVTVDQLATATDCDVCHGCPPAGYTCNICGAGKGGGA